MAYKVSGTESIKDDKTVMFNNITVTQRRASFTSMGAFASFGYNMGGYAGANVNTIDKFSFSSDGNAADVGDLTLARNAGGPNQSDVHGYLSGGQGDPGLQAFDTIDKFPFSTNANAADVGNLTTGGLGTSGQSSTTHGYVCLGATDPNASGSNVINKFTFSVDANATDVGDLTVARGGHGSHSSSTHGYASGGLANLAIPPFDLYNIIDKFPFAADANATDVGDLTVARYGIGGQSSDASGYSSGGQGAAGYDTIDKFPFASDANAADVGNLTEALYGPAGSSSSASGYTAGGRQPSTGQDTNVINKFPFSSNNNATDVGDLTQGRTYGAGTQG